jgi:hypothetical protein
MPGLLVGGRVVRWRLALLAFVAALATAGGPALAQTAGEPVFGAASGVTDEPGSLLPTGNGRFAIQDREYEGTSLGRSPDDALAACFTGRWTSTEEWSIESATMTGAHRSTVRIRLQRGTVTLRLIGTVEYPTASGNWEVVRATGSCDGLEAEGRYTATFSDREPNFRLTFDGRARR